MLVRLSLLRSPRLGYYSYRSWLDNRCLSFSNERQGEESPGSTEQDAG
ncbi:hypothetical protein SAMN06298226_0375 [Nitrosovibrio sp. Nv4]|nr:hypothetical protein SAMN06298226_0375 [Nitrosovibrio sp. Nv4]